MAIHWVLFFGDVVKVRFEHGFLFFASQGLFKWFCKVICRIFLIKKITYLGYSILCTEQIGLAVLRIELQIVKMFKLNFRFFPKPKVTYDVIKFIKTQNHLKVLALIYIIWIIFILICLGYILLSDWDKRTKRYQLISK